MYAAAPTIWIILDREAEQNEIEFKHTSPSYMCPNNKLNVLSPMAAVVSFIATTLLNINLSLLVKVKDCSLFS